MTGDFIEQYLSYTEETESPKTYHRWSMLTCISAMLGRSSYIQFGPDRIYPNLFTMLIGDPGARKSSAIKRASKLVAASGYETFAHNKTTKEKFLLDLEGQPDESDETNSRSTRTTNLLDSTTQRNLFGGNEEPREVFICADEFNEFAGVGNTDFYSTLGTFWDWDDPNRPFTQRVKNTRSVTIFQPTVAILGGNTQENFARAFPAEVIIGQGFMSRLLLIWGYRRKKRIPFPVAPKEGDTNDIIRRLQIIRSSGRGALEVTDGAKGILSDIYSSWGEIADFRFKHYATRRHTQLLKLALCIVAARNSGEVAEEVVIAANTILSAAERNMPTAMGEFGKAINSDITNKVVEMIGAARGPIKALDIFKNIRNDLKNIIELQNMLNSLVIAEKIQYVKNIGGYLPRRNVMGKQEYVDFGLLTQEEREML